MTAPHLSPQPDSTGVAPPPRVVQRAHPEVPPPRQADRLSLVPPAAAPVALPVDVAARVDACLSDVVRERGETLLGVSAELAPVVEAVQGMLGGGKRLRAAFCYWGWLGAGGADVDPDDSTVVLAAAALELFHVAALVHDDVMDRSDTRRGVPTVQRQFAGRHLDEDLLGEPDHHGTSVAILVGDLCLSWSDELIGLARRATGDHRGDEARGVFDTMRTEVIGGQYLDLLEQARATTSESAVQRIVRYKSAKYTVEHPLVLGAALAGAGPALQEGYAAFGLPVGEAFQLRDDVLGVFGDPARTGKPIGDDLRQGKKTLLVSLARERADDAQARLLDDVGDTGLPQEAVDRISDVLVATGAVDEVERRIDALVSTGLVQLAALGLPDATVGALTRLARACSRRAA